MIEKFVRPQARLLTPEEIGKFRKVVVRNVRSKFWVFSKLKHEDKAIHKADYYRIMYRLYNEAGKYIYDWFCCSKCGEILYCNLSKSGSKKLSHHSCYLHFLITEKKKEVQAAEVDDNSNEDVNEDELLSEVDSEDLEDFHVPNELLEHESGDDGSGDAKPDSSESGDDDVNHSDDSIDEMPSEVVEGFHELSQLMEATNSISYKNFTKIWPEKFTPCRLYV